MKRDQNFRRVGAKLNDRRPYATESAAYGFSVGAPPSGSGFSDRR
jgi:hypothetical protein